MRNTRIEFNQNINISKDWTNNQAYHFAFSELFMRRCPQSNEIIGNDQRAIFLPLLNNCQATLSSDCHILDVGGGSGDIVDLSLHQLNQATIHIGEPNPILLDIYLNKIQNYPNLHCGDIFEQPIEYYFDHNNHSIRHQYYDLILAIHMIYHLTDFRQANIEPEQDIINFMQFLFDKLRPGSKMFLVYADQSNTFIGKIVTSFYQQHCPVMAEHMQNIITARQQLLQQQNILTHLAPLSDHPISLTVHELNSHIYANTLAELAMISVIGELGHINNDPFEFERFKYSLDFLNQNGNEVGLTTSNDPLRQGMLQVNQPQIVIELTKQ